MSSGDSSESSPEHVDPQLESLRPAAARDDIPLLLRPAESRGEAMEKLRAAGAENVRRLATESIACEVPGEKLNAVIESGYLESVELDRPVKLFDEGN